MLFHRRGPPRTATTCGSADEGWEIDHFLDEHGAEDADFAWLTDFRRFLPMPDGGEREAFLTGRLQRRDGRAHRRPPPGPRPIDLRRQPDDIVDERLGPDLPMIREWTEQHYDFSGYVTGVRTRPTSAPRGAPRRAGYGPAREGLHRSPCGRSGVGESLLRRVIEAHPAAKARRARAADDRGRGPRIDPDSLPFLDGLEVRPYVHNLYRHLAACDLAVAQGGLTTSMGSPPTGGRSSLPAQAPLRADFHVHHACSVTAPAGDGLRRLAAADAIAEAIARRLAASGLQAGRDDGARKAAEHLAEMLN